MPKSGVYTLDYQKLYPGKYDGKTVIAAPVVFNDGLKPSDGNQIPIYANEGLDHVTVHSRPGSHWTWTVLIAVPK
jgi:hypothetical protein